TPHFCADRSFSSPVDITWRQFSYDTSGLGHVELFARTFFLSPEENNVKPEPYRFEPWIPLPSSDGTWHNFSEVPGFSQRPCIQFRAVFRPSQYCPLYLENIILTYEAEE